MTTSIGVLEIVADHTIRKGEVFTFPTKQKRRPSFLNYGPRLVGVVKILEICCEPTRFSQLYTKSHIAHKKSFLNYLHYCLDKELISKELKATFRERGGFNKWNPKLVESWYSITPKGRQFLELIK